MFSKVSLGSTRTTPEMPRQMIDPAVRLLTDVADKRIGAIAEMSPDVDIARSVQTHDHVDVYLTPFSVVPEGGWWLWDAVVCSFRRSTAEVEKICPRQATRRQVAAKPDASPALVFLAPLAPRVRGEGCRPRWESPFPTTLRGIHLQSFSIFSNPQSSTNFGHANC